MGDASFKPVIYFKQNCPWCLRLWIFLLEAGLMDKIELREFVPDGENEAEIRGELAPHFEKMSFPTIQAAPGVYLNESEAVIALLAEKHGVDSSRLRALKSFNEGTIKHLMTLFQENIELKKQLAAQPA
jgi:glutathione S-transferase